MAEPKRTIKDSIFTFLFGEPEYTMELYQALHPEDTTVKDSDVKLVTLQNVLANGLYNDLGFQVRDKLILLVEAQSTFSENIPLRMLLYLAATYKRNTNFPSIERKRYQFHGLNCTWSTRGIRSMCQMN